MNAEPCGNRHGAFRGRRPRDGLVHEEDLKTTNNRDSLSGLFLIEVYTDLIRNSLAIIRI